MNISLEPKMAYSIAYTNKTLKNHGREGTHLNNKTSFVVYGNHIFTH